MPQNWKTYKKTELGQIPSSWDYEILDNFLELITYGFTNPMPNTKKGPYLVTAKDVKNGRVNYSTARHTSAEAFDDLLTQKSKPFIDDVLITKDGTIGRVAVVDQKGICVNQSVAVLRTNERIRPYFLKYLLESRGYQKLIERDLGGTTIKHIYITRINKMLVGVPSIKEQDEILNVLKSVDEKIELNLAMNKTLEDMAMTLYKHWFVDFGPFQDGEFVDSELGKIPCGWKAQNMGDVVELKQGLAINKKTKHLLCEYSELAIPLFKIRDLLNDTVEHYVKKNEVPKQCIAVEDDLIFTRTGQVGYVFRWKNGCVHNNCFKVIPNEKIDKEYLYQFLINPEIRQYANDIASGSVQKDLNHTAFKSISIVLPPLTVQIDFKDILSPMMIAQNDNRIENQTLTKLRDTLLPKLISGEIRVKDVEQQIAKAI